MQRKNMNYQRVIPRDLFNESKLLKGWARISLLIHDGHAPEELWIDEDRDGMHPLSQGFIMFQDESSGDLGIKNLTLMLRSEPIEITSQYNCTRNYPTLFQSEEGILETYLNLFDDDGEWSTEFIDFVAKKQHMLNPKPQEDRR